MYSYIYIEKHKHAQKCSTERRQVAPQKQVHNVRKQGNTESHSRCCDPLALMGSRLTAGFCRHRWSNFAFVGPVPLPKKEQLS